MVKLFPSSARPIGWPVRHPSSCTLSSHEATARITAGFARSSLAPATMWKLPSEYLHALDARNLVSLAVSLEFRHSWCLTGGWDDHSCHSNSPAASVLVQSEWWKVCAMASNG